MALSFLRVKHAWLHNWDTDYHEPPSVPDQDTKKDKMDALKCRAQRFRRPHRELPFLAHPD